MAGPKVSAPLLQDLAPGDTTIQVPSGLAPDFADANKLYLSAGTDAEGEVVTITARDESAGTFTVTRGADGTSAKTWYSHATTVQPSSVSQGSPFMADDGSLPSTAPSATGAGAVAIGEGAVASGDYAHAIGYNVEASGKYAHAEGYKTIASGNYSHAQGRYSESQGIGSHAEGGYYFAAQSVGASGGVAYAYGSHAEGARTEVTQAGIAGHAEGNGTTVSGPIAHAEGYKTTASDSYSHAEGYKTTASGLGSHAEGYYAIASGLGSHAEGYGAEAKWSYSHAEGYLTESYGSGSHAQGHWTYAQTFASHAEGAASVASGVVSHAGGGWGYTANKYSFAQGSGEPSYGAAAQELRQPMQVYTSDGTQTDMSPGLRVGESAGSVAGFKGQVAAVSKSGYAANWEVSGLAHNFDGTGAVLAAYTVTKQNYTGAGGNLGDNMALTLAASGYDVVAQVTGAASEYIQWAGYMAAANVYGGTPASGGNVS